MITMTPPLRSARSRSRRIPFQYAAVLSLSLAATARAQDPPDLVALSVAGPPQVQIGAVSSVNTFVVNLGGPLVGDIEFDIILTTDLEIGNADDTLVLEHSTAFVGALNVPVVIPPQLSPGSYNWGIHVKPQATETVTFNNSIIGGQVDLFIVDLCVDDASPIEASALQGGDDPASHKIQVSNCGSGGAIMIFSVVQEPKVSWLTVNPTTSFAVAGGEAQPVEISFDITGLPVGVHATQIRIANFGNPDDFEVIPITLTIGEASFDAGDLLIGQILEGGEEDAARCELVKGERLILDVQTTFGNLKPRIEILDAGGALLKAWDLKSTFKKIRRKFKAPASGVYRVVVTGRDGSIGSYLIDTGRKLPKKATARKLKIKADAAGQADVEVRALPGATLDFTIQPKGKDQPGMSVALVHPSGQVLDISAFVGATEKGGLEGVDVPLPDLGDYFVRVTGLASPGDKIKVVVSATQPAAGQSTVLVP